MNTPMGELALAEIPDSEPVSWGSADSADLAQLAGGFWGRVDATAGLFDCWPWTGAMLPNGYGSVWREGRAQKAHRIAWRLTHGPIAEGRLILHRCDNPPCCNPSHLFDGSHADNTRDMVLKGRHNRDGKRHVTAEQVTAIRQAYAAGDATMAALGQRFGVTEAAIHSIVHRRTWRHVA